MLHALGLLVALAGAETRVGLSVYVADEAVDAAWLEEQVGEANRQFAAAGIVFAVDAIRSLPAAAADVATRAQRDRLGRGRLHPGTVTVLVVRRLADVDGPGDIRGVHWHDRADRRRRYIILSKIAPRVVLAHELGHYFGLSHSDDPVSIMNKTRRSEPPPEERRFTDGELEVVRRSRDELLRRGMLAR